LSGHGQMSAVVTLSSPKKKEVIGSSHMSSTDWDGETNRMPWDVKIIIIFRGA
jgi:hypothetical protein